MSGDIEYSKVRHNSCFVLFLCDFAPLRLIQNLNSVADMNFAGFEDSNINAAVVRRFFVMNAHEIAVFE